MSTCFGGSFHIDCVEGTLGGTLHKEPCWFMGVVQGPIGYIGGYIEITYGLCKVVGLGVPSKQG